MLHFEKSSKTVQNWGENGINELPMEVPKTKKPNSILKTDPSLKATRASLMIVYVLRLRADSLFMNGRMCKKVDLQIRTIISL